MRLHTGTSGFHYKAWKGAFYPEKLPDREMLRFYAERLGAVELNNTFYRMPRREVLKSWAAAVPEDFRFAVKASQRITHRKRLRDVEEELAYLLEGLGVLGGRLGAILFQLPPNLRCDLPRLEKFLELLPQGARAAFEFRHPSWAEAAVRERLAERNLALVGVDHDDAPAELDPTASWGYLRLRRSSYREADLRPWAERMGRQPWSEAFAFFKHEDAGPALALGLAAAARDAVARQAC